MPNEQDKKDFSLIIFSFNFVDYTILFMGSGSVLSLDCLFFTLGTPKVNNLVTVTDLLC